MKKKVRNVWLQPEKTRVENIVQTSISDFLHLSQI